ncbi:proprotein convertase P-domain-containing protein [Altererythrobacter sp. ZODW24]|uniref:proprotein convertase P-domain-containing protein n=1 Tax=Altererythrobacter sp. ZODW24 TaxID=2185142 RepID=UPI001964FEBE|nr:proprotein convertase P-domain-containing protein [Altererythrobacter sp. ZODW24]
MSTANRNLSKIFSVSAKVIVMLVLTCVAQTAHAQTVTTYTNTTDTATNGLNETAASCANPLVRTFNVGTSFLVGDVNIGVLAAHTYRGDLVMTLTSPDSTVVSLTTGSGSIGADNFNVLFDDSAGANISTHTGTDTATASTVVPTYQRSFRPTSPLSAFNGTAASGTWTLRVCDQFNQDSGTFYQTDLILTLVPTAYADLSLTKAVSNTAPASVSYTLSVTNASASPSTATGVVVRDLLPAGVNYVSSSGAYNSATGDWTVGSIAPGQTQTLTINATVNATAGATITNTAEVTASSQVDIDSTVNNGITTEDDYASQSFTVSGPRVAGTPPNLSAFCPANQRFFDWQGRAWTPGTTNNSYTLTGIGSINFGLTTDVAFVTGSPAINTTNTGGVGATEQGLFINLNNSMVSDQATAVITLPTAVPGLQFTIFDIDFGNNSFADKVTVTGSYNNTTVLPILTNGTANYVVGNTAIGDVSSAGGDADGNVVVTFTSAVDTITVNYGNHTTAPIDPGNQFMTIHDITFCNPQATIVAAKTSSIVSDPVNGTTDAKAIPGAIVRYCITLTNTGSGTATNLIAADALPPEFAYTAASIKSGTTCAGAATVEDDNNTGADESDPIGASVAASTLTITGATLPPTGVIAVTFDGTIN